MFGGADQEGVYTSAEGLYIFNTGTIVNPVYVQSFATSSSPYKCKLNWISSDTRTMPTFGFGSRLL